MSEGVSFFGSGILIIGVRFLVMVFIVSVFQVYLGVKVQLNYEFQVILGDRVLESLGCFLQNFRKRLCLKFFYEFMVYIFIICIINFLISKY